MFYCTRAQLLNMMAYEKHKYSRNYRLPCLVNSVYDLYVGTPYRVHGILCESSFTSIFAHAPCMYRHALFILHSKSPRQPRRVNSWPSRERNMLTAQTGLVMGRVFRRSALQACGANSIEISTPKRPVWGFNLS